MDEFLKLPIWGYFWNIILILIPVVPTYLVTRYSILKPSNLEIKKKQFHNVYLPLYKLLINYGACTATKNEVIALFEQVQQILFENYELVFPQLHQLNNQLNREIKENKDYKITLDRIIYQIDIEYDSLKNELGYPSSSKFSIYKRMNKRDKRLTWHNIINNFLWILFISSFICVPILMSNGVGIIPGLSIIFLCFFLLMLNVRLWNKVK